jgi:hypothetical protein
LPKQQKRNKAACIIKQINKAACIKEDAYDGGKVIESALLSKKMVTATGAGEDRTQMGP